MFQNICLTVKSLYLLSRWKAKLIEFFKLKSDYQYDVLFLAIFFE